MNSLNVFSAFINLDATTCVTAAPPALAAIPTTLTVPATAPVMPKPTSVPIPNVARPATIEMPTPTVVTAVVADPAVLVANAVPEAVPPMPLVTFE